MKYKVDRGQLTLSFAGFRIQFYWPYFKFKRIKDRSYNEFYIAADTNFRIVVEKGYLGIGGSILGFGMAFDYQNQNK